MESSNPGRTLIAISPQVGPLRRINVENQAQAN